MNSESARLATFNNLTEPTSPFTKRLWAMHGFYLKEGKIVCHFCQSEPASEMAPQSFSHELGKPTCPLISQVDTTNIPLHEVEFLTKNLPADSQLPFMDEYPEFADLEKRLESFASWPQFLTPTPRDLAEAGFFYMGFGDVTFCYSCGKCISMWLSTEHPLVLHKRWGPDCKFIQSKFNAKGKDDDDDDEKCLICLEKSIQVIFIPCGHFISCAGCGTSIETCPICRADIKDLTTSLQ